MNKMVQLDFENLPAEEMQRRSGDFFRGLKRRRTVRHFSSRPIPEGILEDCILAAGSAPSGANLQPWHFAVAQSTEVKRAIREGAEKEEQEFYGGRAPQEWLDALKKFGTNAEKPYLETAPALIAIFQKAVVEDETRAASKTYYPKESVGIATGFLITALHFAGLATLTHTPSPMAFLNRIFERPSNEKPFLLLVVGYPEDGCQVPSITKKSISEIASFH